MSVVFVLVVLALLGGIAVVAAGRGDGLPEPVVDRSPGYLLDDVPADRLDAAALAAARFSTGFRGYRMDQVDEVLDRCGEALTVRDRRIAELEARLPGPEPSVARPAERSVEPPPPGDGPG